MKTTGLLFDVYLHNDRDVFHKKKLVVVVWRLQNFMNLFLTGDELYYNPLFYAALR